MNNRFRKYPRYLDPKTCFDLWNSPDISIHMVVEELRRRGVKNPKTGIAPSDMGVWNSAWLYIFDHLVEGRKLYNDKWKLAGEILTDSVWYELVVSRAGYLLTKGRKQKFLSEHSYLVPYQK